MWVEAILLKGDLEKLLRQLLPVEIALGDQGSLALAEATEVSLRPEIGLHVVCKAKVHWPVLGIDVPVSLHSLAVILRPEVLMRDENPTLVFKLQIEHADVAGVPTVIDDRITDRINRELTAKHVELTWAIGETLTKSFELPAMLVPLDAFALRADAARVKVTGDAMGLAIQFQFAITRDGDVRADATTRTGGETQPRTHSRPAPIAASARSSRRAGLPRTLTVPTNVAIAAGLAAVMAAGAMMGIGRSVGRRRGFFG